MCFKSLNVKLLSVIAMVIMCTLTSCKKDFPPIFKGGHSHSGEPTVLVAGYESNGTHNVATYWVDGQEIKLSDGTQDASANSIVVSGNNDVYVAGSDNGAVYWKNSSEIRLSGDNASSIFVSGNDVYVTGSDGSNTAVYWKNGTEVSLEKNNVYGDFGAFGVNSIFVSGNDVYAAGFEGPNAVYWKNGAEIYLTPSTVGTAGYIHATSIYVSGQDIYIDGIGNTPGSPFLVFWLAENGAFQPGSVSSPFNPGQGNSLFVSGSHVYVAGTQEAPPGYTPAAAYWQDGNLISLPKSEINSYGNAMSVSGNHVYVAGYEYPSSQITYAVYWKDGAETKLTNGTQAAVATSIFIK